MSSPTNRVRLQEPPERRPLLNRAHFSHTMEDAPFFSCASSSNAHLPVYTNIHRIRRDVTSIVEDYLTLEQLRDLRLNISVVRPLVDKLYELDDISIVYCLLVNRSQFLHEQEHMSNRQNVNYTRATLCEVVATRILRRFGEDNPGSQGLLLLANILVAGFEPFQNAPEEVRREAALDSKWNYNRTLPALEIAILTGSRYFLSSTHCQSVVDAIYNGQIIYTPSTFLDLIPDRYKRKPISLYQPHKEPLLNQYRLIVPRTRNALEIIQFIILLAVYLWFMMERNPEYLSVSEVAFMVYAFGWVLDQFATILEHGWTVYTQNLWSFLDVMFAVVYWVYLILRIHGWRTGSLEPAQQALDVLAMGAPVLVPRLAFNFLSTNVVFLSLRAMMANFAILNFLAAWCFCGFLLSMLWLAEGRHNLITISKWMLWIWFGLDGTGVSKSTEFHWLLGPILMITFAFLGNTLFLTILVSMLTNTFSNVVANATAEVHFRKAVLTLEGVKSDAIFAYQPPFNIIALFVLVPMKFFVSARWFHKIHVATVRTINLPVLLIIAALERRHLWADYAEEIREQPRRKRRGHGWFWEKWRITSHGDIHAVFDVAPPDSVENDIAVDDELTHHLIRRQFVRHQSSLHESPKSRNMTSSETSKDTIKKPPSRRDSIAPYDMLPEQLRNMLGNVDGVEDMATRLVNLERSTSRIEELLEKMTVEASDGSSLDGEEMKADEVDTME
ncbi:nonselective cation channel [Xylariaceae sp. FL0255]|nr:nonselective cation channel [Xylariaceae sp. FL0255]